MPIVVDCPGCRKRYEVDASLAGKKSRCKLCGEVFRLPVPSGTVVETSSRRKPAPSHQRPAREMSRPDDSRAGSGSRAPASSQSSAERASGIRRPIILNCPGCGKRYEIDAALGGKKSRCKQCGEIFAIPVPVGIMAEFPPTSGRPAVTPPSAPPKPAPAKELIFEDEPIPFRKPPPYTSSTYEDDELPPPPRMPYPKPARKASSKRAMDPELGVTVAGWFLSLNALAIAALWIYRMVAEPDRARFAWILLPYLGIMYASSIVLALWGGVWVLVVAFRDSITQGVLCLVVPCYQLYYVLTNWEETKGGICLSFGSQIPVIVLGVMMQLLIPDAQPVGANAQNSPAPEQHAPDFGVQPPQQVDEPPPAVAINPGRQPGFNPQPGNARRVPMVRPGRAPFGGRQNFPRIEAPDQHSRRVVDQHGGRAVVVLVTGFPGNSDPGQGVTARDVSEAVNKRLRELAPGATSFSSIGSGSRSKIVLAPVEDIRSLADAIDFGRTVVKGNQIEVTVSPDYIATVPRLPPEQRVDGRDPGVFGQESDPGVPDNSDAVAKSLIGLKSPDKGKKKEAVQRLGRTAADGRVDEVVAALLPLLDDDDGFLVNDVIKALEVWRTPDVVPALIQRTKDNRFFVRHEAIKALGKSKDVRAVEPLIDRFKEDGFQSEDALKELGPIAEPALISRLRDANPEVRRKSCDILKVIGGRETLKAMRALPQDPDLGTRSAANDAYNAIVSRVGPLPASVQSSKSGPAMRGRR